MPKITLRNGRELKCSSIDRITFWAEEQKLEIETNTGFVVSHGKAGFLDLISLQSRCDLGEIKCPITRHLHHSPDVSGL